MSDERRSNEPHNRLTRICSVAVEAVVNYDEHREGDRCSVFLTDDEGGGMMLHGYTDDMEAATDLFTHLRTIFRVNGSDLMLAPLGGNPETN